MKKSPYIILFILFILLACDKTTFDPEYIVPVPLFYDNPLNSQELEIGIDAVPDSDAIQLDWLPHELHEKIKLYRKTEDDEEFSLFQEFTIEDSSLVDNFEIERHKRYYYYMIGIDHDGYESISTDTLSYLLIDKAYNLQNSVSKEIKFFWQVFDIAPAEYTLRLLNEATRDVIWISTIEANRTLEDSASYNWDGLATKSKLKSGERYAWRIDMDGSSVNSGSESSWHRFLVP